MVKLQGKRPKYSISESCEKCGGGWVVYLPYIGNIAFTASNQSGFMYSYKCIDCGYILETENRYLWTLIDEK